MDLPKSLKAGKKTLVNSFPFSIKPLRTSKYAEPR